MSEVVETHEHAEHAAESGRQHTALLIAVLAAALAFTEQGAQHAQTRMGDSALAAADTWAEYQAKSTRANEARDFASVADALGGNAQPARDLSTRFRADADHFENDSRTGKGALAAKARALEARRDAARERLEGLDDASGALQLGIVLTTASVITRSVSLTLGGAALGVIGAVLAVLALLAPALIPF